MPISRTAAQARGRIGGLTRAALAPSRQGITEAARQARWQKYVDQVPAVITDPAERQRRAELLRQADMTRISLKASEARSRAARARREAAQAEAELAEAAGGEGGSLTSTLPTLRTGACSTSG
jgi:hypothetical protein